MTPYPHMWILRHILHSASYSPTVCFSYLPHCLYLIPQNVDGDVEVYEGSGTSGILNLPVLRSAGAIGTVGVSWLATTVSASTADFNPLSGNITLVNGQVILLIVLA